MSPPARTPPEGEHDSLRPDSSESYLDVTEEWVDVSADSDAPTDGSRPEPVPAVADSAKPTIDAGSPPEPDATLPSGRAQTLVPQERHGRGQVRGIARSVQLRKVGDTEVLSFRVDRFDGSGNRLAPVGVELYPYRGGQVSDGEEIDVAGNWKDGTLQGRKAVNLTTGAQMTGGWPRSAKIFGAIFLLFFLGIPIASFLIAKATGGI